MDRFGHRAALARAPEPCGGVAYSVAKRRRMRSRMILGTVDRQQRAVEPPGVVPSGATGRGYSHHSDHLLAEPREIGTCRCTLSGHGRPGGGPCHLVDYVCALFRRMFL